METYLRGLHKLMKSVRELDRQVDEQFLLVRSAPKQVRPHPGLNAFKKLNEAQTTFRKFHYKQKVVEELALVAENLHEKNPIQPAVDRKPHHPQAAERQHIIATEQENRALEEFTRMSTQILRMPIRT